MTQKDFEPTISVIVPIRIGAKCSAVSESLLKVDYPQERIELIVIEGKQPSRQRNMGVKEAHGEIIYFFDDDSEFPENIFRKTMRHYENQEVAAIAGLAVAKKDAPKLSRAANLVFASIFGGCTGRYKYKSIGKAKRADDKYFILCNASIRREVFLSEGGFVGNLYPGEENEFFRRLNKKGYKLIYEPEAIIYRNWRHTLKGYVVAIFIYGRAKIDQGFAGYSLKDYLFFVPLVFLLYLLSFIFIKNFYYRLPIYTYFLLAVFFTLKNSITNREWVGLSGIILFPLMHVSFASGMIWGFVKKWFFPRKKEAIEGESKIRRMKKLWENTYENNNWVSSP